MDTKKLYNDVYIKSKISEASFCRAFNDAAGYIYTKYGAKNSGAESKDELCIGKVGDESSLFDVYYTAVAAYILYTAEKGDEYRNEFIRAADTAYCGLWRGKIKGKRIRRVSF